MSKETKQCSQCRKTRPVDEFNKCAANKDGRHSKCRDCARAWQRQWKEKNRERVAETNRRYREQNPEAVANAVRRFQSAAHADTKASATRLNAKWSDEDCATVMRSDISLTEISKLLGRTYGSVVVKRSNLSERQRRLEIVAAAQRRIAG